MTTYVPSLQPEGLKAYTMATASAAVGCALGILFGRGMERRSSNITAISLLAAGALIAAPVVTGIINRAVNRPGTERGSRKRLEGIRDSAVPAGDDEIYSLDNITGL